MSRIGSSHVLRRTSLQSKTFFTSSSSSIRWPSSLSQIRQRWMSSGTGFTSYHQNVRLKSAFVWGCIGVNVMVWALWTNERRTGSPKTAEEIQARLKRRRLLQENFLLSDENIKAGRYWTMITAGFSHVGGTHLLFNMISFQQLSQLFVHSAPGVTLVGHMLPLTLGSILAGSFAFLLHRKPDNSQGKKVGLGFSGAVSGIVTAASCLFPKQKMLFFGIIPVPLWLLGLGYVAYDTYAMDGPSNVAHDAHIGGAIFGGLFYLARLRRFGGIAPRFGSR